MENDSNHQQIGNNRPTLIDKIQASFSNNAFRNRKTGRIDMKFRMGV